MRSRTSSGTAAAFSIAAAAVALSPSARGAIAGTAFSYQGQLKKNGAPVSSTCNFQFSLWADAAGTVAAGTNPQTALGVAVTNGLFTATIDFGAGSLNGDARWLGIAAQCAGDGGFTPLAPLQPLTPVPIAGSLPGLATFQGGVGAQLRSSGYGYVQTDGTISAGTYVGTGGGWFGTKSNHPLYLFTNNSQPQVTLSTGGSLGIATTSPTAPLDVVTPSGGYGFLHRFGTIAVGTYAGSGASGENGGWIGTKSNHDLYFFTNNSGAKMTLDGSGNLGIGTITPSSKLDVNGDASFFGAISVAGTVSLALTSGGTQTICVNTNGADGTIAQCSSSLRYKSNVADLANGLDTIEKLRPVTFDWKGDGSHDLGFVAEDVHEAVPLLSTYGRDGRVEGVKYDRMSAVLVKGVQEQQAEIESLRTENAELARKNAELEARLIALERRLAP